MIFDKISGSVTAAGFAKADPGTMAQIIEYFGLRSTPEMLEQVRRQYFNSEMRDPTSDELYLIDALLNLPPTRPSQLILTSVEAEDRDINETYADAVKKLAELTKGRPAPYSFDEIAYPAEKFFAATSKAHAGISRIYAGRDAIVRAAAGGENLIALKGKRGRAAMAMGHAAPVEKPDPNDVIMLIAPTDISATGENFPDALSKMIFMNRNIVRIKALAVAEGGDLLSPLLNALPGASIDLLRLPEQIGLRSPELLLTGFEDCAALVISRNTAYSLSVAAHACGLAAFFIGTPINVKRLTVSCGRGMPATFNCDFLRSLYGRVCTPAVIVGDNAADSNAGYEREFDFSSPVTGGSSSSVATAHGVLFTGSDAGAPSFAGAALAMIEATAKMIAAGARRDGLTATFDAGISGVSSPEASGDSLAMLLGLYRAQAELCVVSRGSSVKTADEPYLDIFLAAKAPQQPIPDKLSRPGSRVYLLAPRTTAAGLPDYRDLRAIYSYFSKFTTDSAKPLSAHAIGREGYNAALAEYLPEGLNIDAPEFKGVPCGSLLVETDREIEGHMIGRTEIAPATTDSKEDNE